MFTVLAIVDLLAVSLFARDNPWAWCSLVMLALLVWYFEDESVAHKTNLTKWVGDLCEANKMVRIGN